MAGYGRRSGHTITQSLQSAVLAAPLLGLAWRAVLCGRVGASLLLDIVMNNRGWTGSDRLAIVADRGTDYCADDTADDGAVTTAHLVADSRADAGSHRGLKDLVVGVEVGGEEQCCSNHEMLCFHENRFLMFVYLESIFGGSSERWRDLNHS